MTDGSEPLSSYTLKELLQATFALYLEEYGPSGYNRDTFIDFVVAQTRPNPFGMVSLSESLGVAMLIQFYSERIVDTLKVTGFVVPRSTKQRKLKETLRGWSRLSQQRKLKKSRRR